MTDLDWQIGRALAPLAVKWVPGASFQVPPPFVCFVVVRLDLKIGPATACEFRVTGSDDGETFSEMKFNAERIAYRYTSDTSERLVVPVIGYRFIRGEARGIGILLAPRGAQYGDCVCSFSYLNMTEAFAR